MAKLPAIQFYPGDWLRDQVASTSYAAQGLWLRMMMVMHDCTPYGHLAIKGVAIPPATAAKMCGGTLEEYCALLAELENVGVPRRNPDGIIYSKRMVDDAKKRERDRRNGKKGGNPRLIPPDNPPINPTLKIEDEDEDEDEDPGKRVQGENQTPFADLIPVPQRTPAVLDAWRRWAKWIGDVPEDCAMAAFDLLADRGVEWWVQAITCAIANKYKGFAFPKNGTAKETPAQWAARVAGKGKPKQ